MLVEGTLSYSVCRCTHLTNFAILMQVVPLEVRARTGPEKEPFLRQAEVGARTAHPTGQHPGGCQPWGQTEAASQGPLTRDIWEALLWKKKKMASGVLRQPECPWAMRPRSPVS